MAFILLFISACAQRFAQAVAVQITVKSQGTLLPRTESDLSAEVSGRIIEVADNFRAGGTFVQGGVLLRVYATDRGEIRLPVTLREVALLETKDRCQRHVRLRKADSPDASIWVARFARVEATIDPASHLFYAYFIEGMPVEVLK